MVQEFFNFSCCPLTHQFILSGIKKACKLSSDSFFIALHLIFIIFFYSFNFRNIWKHAGGLLTRQNIFLFKEHNTIYNSSSNFYIKVIFSSAIQGIVFSKCITRLVSPFYWTTYYLVFFLLTWLTHSFLVTVVSDWQTDDWKIPTMIIMKRERHDN